MEKCRICTTMAPHGYNSDSYFVDCPRCGRYTITGSAHSTLEFSDFSERQRANISGWLRGNQVFKITSSDIDSLGSIGQIPFAERVDRLLCRIGEESEYAGAWVEYSPAWISYAWCIHEEEMQTLLSWLSELKRVVVQKIPSLFNKTAVLPDGWLRIEELKSINAESDKAFVAMWFDESMLEVYGTAISKAIEDAGYRPHRVDNKEHNGKIDDEIVAEIRKSRFVVADFTDHRGGVYYEAGFAKGLGLEVFWTCRDDYFDKLHFDIRQYNCIKWSASDLDGFRRQLHYRIESVLGHGPVRK